MNKDKQLIKRMLKKIQESYLCQNKLRTKLCQNE